MRGQGRSGWDADYFPWQLLPRTWVAYSSDGTGCIGQINGELWWFSGSFFLEQPELFLCVILDLISYSFLYTAYLLYTGWQASYRLRTC